MQKIVMLALVVLMLFTFIGCQPAKEELEETAIQGGAENATVADNPGEIELSADGRYPAETVKIGFVNYSTTAEQSSLKRKSGAIGSGDVLAAVLVVGFWNSKGEILAMQTKSEAFKPVWTKLRLRSVIKDGVVWLVRDCRLMTRISVGLCANNKRLRAC